MVVWIPERVRSTAAIAIIAHCVWLYFRFSLSFRDIQEMMLERGVDVSHEAIRLWCLTFGAEYARRLRRPRGRSGDTWHLDQVFCKINGQLVYFWRAVDQSGEVLDVLAQKRRMRKPRSGSLECCPRVIGTCRATL